MILQVFVYLVYIYYSLQYHCQNWRTLQITATKLTNGSVSRSAQLVVMYDAAAAMWPDSAQNAREGIFCSQ